MKKQAIFIFLIFVLIPIFAFPQKRQFDFMGIRLGMSLDQVKSTVASNDSLRFDDTRYLDKMNDAIPYTIKLYAFPFINNLYIEFYEKQSYNIILILNPEYFDYFNLTETLEDKYGLADLKTSKFARWNNVTSNTVMVLEAPATIKIYDDALMTQVQALLKLKQEKDTNETILQIEKTEILSEL